MSKETGRLSRGYKNTKGTKTMHFMTHDKISHISVERTVIYAGSVCDYWPQRLDTSRVRITVGGYLINYYG